MIKFKYGDEEYKLTFTRQTASDAEKAGFKFDKKKIEDMPVTSVIVLETYAFKAMHPDIDDDTALDIVSNFKNKDGLIQALMKEYSNAIDTLMSEPDAKNAIEWTVT
ncbi:MAG TPA: DUF5055 domain-containing protein [Candidatus Eubacterium faecipullorum]|uniref:DUF5055 domain-containing protein n=1 Tax=Candidatus Eubacterium faecipullorum TaxID=2838571 RepID=A0A9D1UG54_9FIRM|nr:DUF5055 domain-containing protein [Candidatus Eubacterium faecipullorum]